MNSIGDAEGFHIHHERLDRVQISHEILPLEVVDECKEKGSAVTATEELKARFKNYEGFSLAVPC